MNGIPSDHTYCLQIKKLHPSFFTGTPEKIHHTGKGKISEKEDNGTIPILQETLAQKVDMLKLENWCLTKNLKLIEKEYVLAMKSKYSNKPKSE